MFGKLKEKLKSALAVFSRKTEEEAEEKKVAVTPATPEVKKEAQAGKKEIVKEEKKQIIHPPRTEAQKVKELKKIKEVKEVREVKEIQETKGVKEIEEGKPVTTEPEIRGAPEKLTPQPEAEKPEKKSFFGKIKEMVTTKTISADKFEELFWELEVALLENNVSVKVIEKIKEDLKQELVEKPLPRDVERKIQETLKHTLQEIVSFGKIDLIQNIRNHKEKPYIIAFFGINGSGKTTSIDKLNHYQQKHKLSVVMSYCYNFRAAAIQQLEEHADKLGVKMIKHEYGSDAAAVAFDAVKYAQKNKVDVVLIDTAGRLHSNTNLMAELEKIMRVTKPHLKIFVGESITGNDCIEQAQQFDELVDLDGSILTKADVDEKGGAPLSIAYTIQKPILFLGVGQKYGDLEEFNPAKILERLGL